MIKPNHIMVEPHYIMIKPHHIMIKPHYIMTKPHHIMTKPHHIMMYQNYNMTKLHHITTKRQRIMIIVYIRKLWLSIHPVAKFLPCTLPRVLRGSARHVNNTRLVVNLYLTRVILSEYFKVYLLSIGALIKLIYKYVKS